MWTLPSLKTLQKNNLQKLQTFIKIFNKKFCRKFFSSTGKKFSWNMPTTCDKLKGTFWKLLLWTFGINWREFQINGFSLNDNSSRQAQRQNGNRRWWTGYLGLEQLHAKSLIPKKSSKFRKLDGAYEKKSVNWPFVIE